MEKNSQLKRYKALVVGGSAGSLNVILQFLPLLRADLYIAIIIVLHRKQINDSLLTDILSSKTGLLVKEAEEKEKIKPGYIYVAPPNYHLLIERDETFSLDDSEKINFSRPSIDITFESASLVYESALAALLLSGANTDGTDGSKSVIERNGLLAIQTPDSAEISFMPANAMANTQLYKLLEPSEIADFINNLQEIDIPSK